MNYDGIIIAMHHIHMLKNREGPKKKVFNTWGVMKGMCLYQSYFSVRTLYGQLCYTDIIM